MDMRLTPEQEKFREEVHDFIRKEATEELFREVRDREQNGPATRAFVHKLADKRWICPHWPEKYGGMGASHMQRFIITEEMSYTGVPGGGGTGAGMAGPVILKFGSDYLKEEYLPRIARGEIEFVLGYTEPNAGSDMANIDIRAVDKGDYFLLNGQKIFNTGSHPDKYHWLGARTSTEGPKHKGLSLFVVPMNLPGITIREFECQCNMTSHEVFYDDVKLPKRQLVGELNRGFYEIAMALDLERNFSTAGHQRLLEELTACAKETKRNGKALIEDPLVREKLAQLKIEVEVVKLLSYRVACLIDKGTVPNFESSQLKLYHSELGRRLTGFGMQLLGLYGPLKEGSKYAALEGDVEREYRAALLFTIGGGTSEIQRNIIAQRGLGMPRA